MHIDEKNSDYHKFKVAKYLLIADFRDRGMVKNLNPSKSAQLVSKPENCYGENIKVIIGTDITKEGLDFKNIRNVHLIESWYNLSKHEQIIGRAIRYCSHIDLPENERNVTIYQYTSATALKSSKKQLLTETIDQKNYRIAENKDVQIRNILHLLKQSAVDCIFNKNGNIIKYNSKDKKQLLSDGSIIKNIDYNIPYSRECDYQKNCNYKCAWEKDPKKNYELDTYTYDIKFAKNDINECINIIKKMYTKNIIYTLEQIIIAIKAKKKNIENIFIYKALDIMLNDKNEIVYNKFGVKGYLVYYGQYYIFQPSNIKYEQIPMYYRDYLFATKTKKVNLEYLEGLNKEKYKNFISIDTKIESTQEKKSEKKLKNNKNNNKNIDINNYLTFKKNYLSYYKLFNVLQSIIKENDYNLLITKIYLNYLNNDLLEKLFKKTIKIINEKKTSNELYDNVYQYLKMKNRLFYEDKLINGFSINSKKYIYKKKYKKWFTENIKETNNNKSKLNKIYGLYSFNKKIVFKIGIYDEKEIKKTVKGSVSKKSKRSGKVCTSYDIKELSVLLNNLNNNFKSKYKKAVACFLLEIILNYYDLINKNNNIWLIYES